MNLVDFAIGVLIVNALAHFIFGITNTHYLGMFGYSAKGNIAYGLLQFIAAIVLLLVNYSLDEILNNGFVVGGLFVLVLFLVFGKFSVKIFGRRKCSKSKK